MVIIRNGEFDIVGIRIKQTKHNMLKALKIRLYPNKTQEVITNFYQIFMHGEEINKQYEDYLNDLSNIEKRIRLDVGFDSGSEMENILDGLDEKDFYILTESEFEEYENN